MAVLRLSEAGTHGARRVTRQRIARSLRILGRAVLTETDVHQARKALRRARAALRLLREPLGRRTFRQENTTLRDAARVLTPLRDSTALLEALERLAADRTQASAPLDLNGLRRRLRQLRTGAQQELVRAPKILAGVQRQLRAASRRAEHWEVGSHGWSALGPALERGYALGQAALRAAQAANSDESLHEWRKQAKSLEYQLQLLQAAAPRVFGRVATGLRRLTALLGYDHDLALLRQRACTEPELFASRSELERFRAYVDTVRSRLQREAYACGRPLYQAPPQIFAVRLERQWRAWRVGEGGRRVASRARRHHASAARQRAPV
jgi:CHAD domain-containing protein